jgi:hypothetical protein
MATKLETIFVYNENCVMAGKAVPQRELDQHGEDCGDWHAEELTEENAAWHDARGQYGWKVARTIRERL